MGRNLRRSSRRHSAARPAATPCRCLPDRGVELSAARDADLVPEHIRSNSNIQPAPIPPTLAGVVAAKMEAPISPTVDRHAPPNWGVYFGTFGENQIGIDSTCIMKGTSSPRRYKGAAQSEDQAARVVPPFCASVLDKLSPNAPGPPPFSSLASTSRSRFEPVHIISRKYARFTRP
jgi:hypothetical protein